MQPHYTNLISSQPIQVYTEHKTDEQNVVRKLESSRAHGVFELGSLRRVLNMIILFTYKDHCLPAKYSVNVTSTSRFQLLQIW